MRLTEFLKSYSGLVEVIGSVAEASYQDLSIDSRTIGAGQLYVAIVGETHDGHNFVEAALQNGASAAVVAQSWLSTQHREPETNYIVVNDTLDFLQQLASWHRQQFQIPVIAVTGSNGKTTTRQMIGHVLAEKHAVFQSEGNKNNHIGLPLMLLRLNESYDVAVLEIGTNNPGEIGHLARLALPTEAAITNIGAGHIGNFGSLAAIYTEKTSLFEEVSTGGTVHVNMADQRLQRYHRSDVQKVSVGLETGFDVSGSAVGFDATGCMKMKLFDDTEIQLAVPGAHQLTNALLAVSVGLQHGLTTPEVANALETFEAVGQRMQTSMKQGVLVINDAYNANPDSMRAAVQYLDGLEQLAGQRFFVAGDMLEMGEFENSSHRDLGSWVAASRIDRFLAYGPLMKNACEVVAQQPDKSGIAEWFSTHDEIRNILKKELREGDALLVKGSRGMKMESVLENLFD